MGEGGKRKGKKCGVWRDPKFQGKIRLVPCVHIQHNFFPFFESRSADRRKKKTNLSFFFRRQFGKSRSTCSSLSLRLSENRGSRGGKKRKGFMRLFPCRQIETVMASLPPPLYPRRLWPLQEKRGFGGGGGIWRLLHSHPFLPLPSILAALDPFCCSRVRFTEKISYKSRGMLLFPLRFC